MNTRPLPQLLEEPFRVESIAPIPNPQGGSDQWHRYTICQGSNVANAIVGSRGGSLAEVSEQVRQMVERLNERAGKIKKK